MQGNDDQSVNQAKLYVGNLPYSVMDEELRELFAQFGEVVDAVVIKHSQNGGHLAGKSKGFGFVTMSTAEEAQAAVEAMNEKEVDVAHEATVGKVEEDQLFYLMSRGLSQDEAIKMIVSGFIEPLIKELPMEYAVELNRLIELEIENSVC